jgi:4-alpha-glucanotransferase
MGKLPLIAEDLGDITADVHMLMEDFGLPGMKVLQFAFDASLLNSPHIPHAPNFHNGIVYTGTHDNNTTRGWFKYDLDSDAKKRLQAYLGQPCGEEEVAHQLIRLAQSSPAFRVIVPMQDILALDESARMNRPGTATGNWGWRLKGDEDYKAIADQLKLLSKLYGRTE